MSPVERSGGGGGGTTSPLTTKGDVYTYSTGNARLAVGSDHQVLTANSAATTGNDWEYPTGYELDYVQITSPVTVTSTTEATPTLVIQGNAVTYSGSQRIRIEFSAPYATIFANETLVVCLWDGATEIGELLTLVGSTGNSQFATQGSKFLTPSAGSHTYAVQAFKTGVGAQAVGAGTGVTTAKVPAWYRITTA